MADKDDSKKKNSKKKIELEKEEKITIEEEVVATEEGKETQKPEAERDTSDDEETTESVDEDDSESEETDTKEDASEENLDEKAQHSTVYGDGFDAVTVEKRFSFMRFVFFFFVIVISAIIFFAGMLYFQSGLGDLGSLGQMNPFSKPSPTPTETSSPTPTPEPELTLSDYNVQVLNGSGVPGAAGQVAGVLEEEGFVDVEAGNAQEQDFEETEIQMKEDVPEQVYAIIESALTQYTVVEGSQLDDDFEFDVIVTVGQETETEDE